jgi:SAM-dependent methyltransferase
VQRYVRQLNLSDEGTVLDIGCGRGHVLHLILSQSSKRGIGVDSSPLAIARAANDLAPLVAAGRLTLVNEVFDASRFAAESLQLVICIGSTHAAGGYRATLQAAKRLLRAEGLLLIGEGYWKTSPADEYLAFLGMSAEEQSTHLANQAAGVEEGFELLACSQCNLEEWDVYEGQYARNVEAYVAAHDGDPDAPAMLARIHAWRAAYLRWGRDALGFGLYLFRARPDEAAVGSDEVGNCGVGGHALSANRHRRMESPTVRNDLPSGRTASWITRSCAW